MSFILPHAYFRHLYTQRYAVFVDIVSARSREKLREFWEGVQQRKDPRFQQLENRGDITNQPGWMERLVAFSVHGDAVPCIAVGKAGTRSLNVISIQSVMASYGSSLKVKQPVCAVFKDKEVDETSPEMGRVILWSLRALEQGKFQAADHNGVQ